MSPGSSRLDLRRRRGASTSSGQSGSPTNTNGGSSSWSSRYCVTTSTDRVRERRSGRRGSRRTRPWSTKPKSSISSNAPLSTMRRPSSRIATRHLVDHPDVVGLRALTAGQADRARSAHRPRRAGPVSPDRRRATSVSWAVSPSRSAAPCVSSAVTGAASGGESRMRSIAASARSGRVSHVGERISHSFGPRARRRT